MLGSSLTGGVAMGIAWSLALIGGSVLVAALTAWWRRAHDEPMFSQLDRAVRIERVPPSRDVVITSASAARDDENSRPRLRSVPRAADDNSVAGLTRVQRRRRRRTRVRVGAVLAVVAGTRPARRRRRVRV